MPLPASLVASIVSAILETATQSSATVSQNAQQYENYVTSRTLPPEAKLGSMLPPTGNGQITINGKILSLSPTAQFRNSKNLIVMPMTIQEKKDIVYITDPFGAVHRVWMVSQAEISALPKN